MASIPCGSEDPSQPTIICPNYFENNIFLKYIEIGKAVGQIGANAFKNCKNL
jgi:hypothetical protein